MRTLRLRRDPRTAHPRRAPLPTTIADAEPSLVQVLPPVAELTRGWYLLTRQDLRKTPRVAAFFDFVLGELPALRTILMG